MGERIPQWRPAEARAWMAEHEPGALAILDVRQPAEFERRHLPGALLVPLPELPFRLDEVPRDRRVLTVCHAGMRSMAAALQLVAAGWEDVVNLAGGMAAWDGPAAAGGEEVGIALFRPARDAAELRAMVAGMERGAHRFLARASELLREAGDAPAAVLLDGLARDELGHAEALGAAPEEGDRVEGGFPLAPILAWLEAGRSVAEILDLALAMEATALDRYLRLARRVDDPEARGVIERLAAEEHRHVEELARLRELHAARA